MTDRALSADTIFATGEPLPEALRSFFTGQVYLQPLSGREDQWNCPIVNVTFEPGCRNSWHKHPGGQILLVTGGRGLYQEWGQPARELHAGDVVRIPRNVKHWHGAAKDSWFVHLSIETNCQAGPAEWLEPVAADTYDELA
jgi:quercetin dioxygenase-like cupin family protein